MSERYNPGQILALHQRLLNGDRIASEEVASLFLEPLVRELSQKFPQTDEQIVWDGVIEAILDYCDRPEKFDVARTVPLDRFLQMAAWRNIANLLRGEKRRKDREEKAGQLRAESVVELNPEAGNLLWEKKSIRQYQRAELLQVLHDPKDRKIMELRLQGERRTQAFAEILEITHLPIDAQRREVKRVKDRIDKALRRHKGT